MSIIKAVLHSVASHPWVFDRIQSLLGFKQTCQRLTPYLAPTDGQIVLDVGAGTGNYTAILPRSATYVWLDNDPQKLQGFKTKWPSAAAILGDATQLCLRDKSVDTALCIALTHHLSDLESPLLLRELQRVTMRNLILLDAVQRNHSKLSALLWKYDRGSYPRSAEALAAIIQTWFEIEQVEKYTIYHRYLLCLGTPKPGV